MKTKEKPQFLKLKSQGLSLRIIAEKLNISLDTALRWNSDLKEEIKNLDALNKEHIKKEISSLIETQVHQIKEQLEAINKEFKKRDLSDITTDKLITMQLKQLEYLATTKPKYLSWFTGKNGIKLENIRQSEEIF